MGEVYPGYGMAGWVLEGYTGYYPPAIQDPYLVIFSLKTSTHGQMKAFFEVSHEVSEIRVQIDPELTSD